MLGGAGADIETPPKEEDDDGKGLKGFTLQMYIAVKRDNIICYFMRIVAFFQSKLSCLLKSLWIIVFGQKRFICENINKSQGWPNAQCPRCQLGIALNRARSD